MSLSITNNGHSVQVDFNDSDDRTAASGSLECQEVQHFWGGSLST
ncbi:CA7 isoform 3 [Pongo abelii]|uniref:CA7 isoform 3 n=1 Tax=Pongo abelii TaxID=9601 RepID=A0A2J8VUB6_PONAB|nr:CA7 isoform 3 [Pongo abelii]